MKILFIVIETVPLLLSALVVYFESKIIRSDVILIWGIGSRSLSAGLFDLRFHARVVL